MGSGTIFKAIGKSELADIRLVRSPDRLAGHANEIFREGSEMIRALTFNNRALARLRDMLLPKLVSGQIDVSKLDLDELVGSVA